MQQDIREGLAAFQGQADLINCRLVIFHVSGFLETRYVIDWFP